MNAAGSWFSQPFPPAGGITAEGLRNQLGRPALSLLTILVRETAQNSWDARTDSSVSFAMDLGRFGPAQLGVWRRAFGTGAPPVRDDLFPLRALLRRPEITYLMISDRGTKGLGGPTRSDHTAEPGERNWLSFVLNSGEARDTEGGGGTYGYGKGVFFMASRVGTVLIHTRFREGDQLVSRLIGSALCHSFDMQDRPFTGRHWWGLPQRDHCEPLVGADADRFAAELGLPGFRGDETGTTVVVVDPDLSDPAVSSDEAGQLALPDAGRYLAEAASWNLWPVMLASRPQRMAVSVKVDGTPVPVPDETTDANIAYFAAAYEALRGQPEELWCGNPKKLLARVHIDPTFGAVTDSWASRDLGVEGAPHHVCVMRMPELVVRYVAGPVGPHPAVGYAGVLRIDDQLDEVFARAEPPTHDDWVHSQLTGREATYVRVLLQRRLKAKLDEQVARKSAAVSLALVRVGSVADRLGHLVAAATSLTDEEGSVGPGSVVFPPVPTSPGNGAAPGGDGADGASRRRTRGAGRPRLDGPARFVVGAFSTLR